MKRCVKRIILAAIEPSLGHPPPPPPTGGSYLDRIDAVSGRYTAIAGDVGYGYYARPLYYGLLLAQHLAGGTFMGRTLEANGVNLTGYAVKKDGKKYVVLINKDLTFDVTVQIQTGERDHWAQVSRLNGPSLDNVHDVEFGGSQVAYDGTWRPMQVERIEATTQGFAVSIPSGSAALLWIA